MAKKPLIDDEDRDSFARAVEGTRPLGGRGEYIDPVRKPVRHILDSRRAGQDDPMPAFRARRDPGSKTKPSKTRGSPLSPTAEDMPRNSGIQKKTRRELVNGKSIKRSRSGSIPDDITIDLHGMTLFEAERRLMRFLDDAFYKGKRCVLVIHGKGHGSPDNRTTIKANIGNWLDRHHAVLDSSFAQIRDGGTGASYVLLRVSTTR
ncbi:Smr/MutS family protein [Thioalkalivibrio sp. HK1]|uniref:Smr/MutS family protein n=1 Tax=Thioalkalivibrio sp. HK1 TaxID=1469245 RepID=UPI000471432D|nr:Smr/MutS family protein [Thioalkalivibrio sp. HK1]